MEFRSVALMEHTCFKQNTLIQQSIILFRTFSTITVVGNLSAILKFYGFPLKCVAIFVSTLKLVEKWLVVVPNSVIRMT